MTDPATMRLDPVIRPATEDDIGGIDRLLDGHDAVSGAPPIRPGVRAAHLRQALRRGTVHVAQFDGAIVGFGTTLDTGRAVHLADLFVDRDDVIVGGGPDEGIESRSRRVGHRPTVDPDRTEP